LSRTDCRIKLKGDFILKIFMKNKTWKKPKIIQAEIGKCRYCYKIVFNTDSFVSFLSEDENGQREKAHHSCMKKDYYKNLINKNKDKEINNRLG